MTAEIRFFPLGNADTLRIDLADGRKVLVDYANMRNGEAGDLRCDLPTELTRDLRKSGRDYFDVVCITHLDDDHCKGFGEFFWLEHAACYQSEDRVRIKELWVPAGAILEENLKGDARLVRAEARRRLRDGKGIRIFSRPDQLRLWMAVNEIDFASRQHLMVDAGSLVPGFAKEGPEQAEFFVHSPFGWRQDDGITDRNQNCIVMQVTFREAGRDTHLLLGSDVDHEAIAAIVHTTIKHGRADRLKWDLMKLFHHCSYLSIGPVRGVDETEAVPEVAWLFEEQGQSGAYIVSPSKPIPAKGSQADEDVQPPHRQAAAHHRRVVKTLGGRFMVTMETPSQAKPTSFAFEVTAGGIALKLAAPMVATTAASETPRAG